MEDEKRLDDPNFVGDHAEVPYDMTTAGEEDTTLWDNMVQAFKPDLLHPKRRHNTREESDH